MSLETASFISQLNSANPPGGDPVANAADHLRLIKSVLQSQFPNFGTSQVTPTAQQLSNNLVPVGGILMWSGSIDTIPSGWGLCNGSTYAKLDGSGDLTAPDLTDKFILGAGGAYSPGSTGGSFTASSTLAIGNTSLTIDQLPNLPVTISDTGHSHGVSDPGHNHADNVGGQVGVNFGSGTYTCGWSAGSRDSGNGTGISINSNTTGITASISGPAGNAHGHSLTGTITAIPPYYALAFIIKL